MNIAIYDEVTNRIVSVLESISAPDYAGRTDVLFAPDLSTLAGIPQKYWKQNAGKIITMTDQEMADLDVMEAQAAKDSSYAQAKAVLIDPLQGVVYRAVIAWTLAQTNDSRKVSDIIGEVLSKITSGAVDQ